MLNLDKIISFINEYLLISIAALMSITFHEVSHGYIAYKLGDNTAKNLGRLSLNPIKHIDVFGLLMLIIFGFGWAKPVPVNMNNFKNPKKGMAITALAGPVSNMILAFFSLLLIALLAPFYNNIVISYIINFLFVLTSINIGLGIFNLIPIPPLDGSKILNSLLPNNIYYTILQFERYGFILMMIILQLGILDPVLFFLRTSVYNFLWLVASTPIQFIYGFIF